MSEADSVFKKCGDDVKIGARNKPQLLACLLAKGHAGYHRGDGWVWDERRARPSGQEPREERPKRRRA